MLQSENYININTSYDYIINHKLCSAIYQLRFSTNNLEKIATDENLKNFILRDETLVLLATYNQLNENLRVVNSPELATLAAILGKRYSEIRDETCKKIENGTENELLPFIEHYNINIDVYIRCLEKEWDIDKCSKSPNDN